MCAPTRGGPPGAPRPRDLLLPMISNILTRIFGSRNERLLKQYRAVVREINALEPALSALDDAALRAKTGELKERVAKGDALDDVLPEAFAVVREAGKRSLGMRHFDVQLIAINPELWRRMRRRGRRVTLAPAA